jgi:microcystin-dependent protein
MAQRREYKGAAVQSAIASGISNSATSITLTDATGWPTGSIGPFLIVIDPGLSTEEKVTVTSRSGTTLTVASRGADSTTASAHSVNAIARHVLGATDIDLANKHAADTTQDDHTQYVHISTARTISANHTFSGTPTFSGAPVFSGAAHFTGTPVFDNMGASGDIAIVDANAKAAGVSPKPARADHKHDLDLIGLANVLFGAGFVVPTAGTSVPSGWLECNGQAVSRAGYPALFAAISINYGAGDGSTTFNVPDLRDRFLSGAGTARSAGSVGGADSVVLATANLPAHNHGVTDSGHVHGITDNGHIHGPSGSGGSTGFVFAQGGPQNNSIGGATSGNPVGVTFTGISSATTGITVNSATTGISIQNTGSGTAISIVPKFFAAPKVLIKAH